MGEEVLEEPRCRFELVVPGLQRLSILAQGFELAFREAKLGDEVEQNASGQERGPGMCKDLLAVVTVAQDPGTEAVCNVLHSEGKQVVLKRGVGFGHFAQAIQSGLLR